MKTISAVEARALVAQGAVLIDVREADEHARERIAGARSMPLSSGSPSVPQNAVLVYHCKSGNRTSANAATLRHAAEGASCEAFILEGGLEAWKSAGFSVARDNKAPLEIMRQVQITSGGLALFGFLLGVGVHPGFHALSGFIGAGLLFAGASGWCGMAKLLALMPWNRAAAA
ncbi:MAG: rhodanese family protein [Caulobacterales bacterium]